MKVICTSFNYLSLNNQRIFGPYDDPNSSRIHINQMLVEFEAPLKHGNNYNFTILAIRIWMGISNWRFCHSPTSPKSAVREDLRHSSRLLYVTRTWYPMPKGGKRSRELTSMFWRIPTSPKMMKRLLEMELSGEFMVFRL